MIFKPPNPDLDLLTNVFETQVLNKLSSEFVQFIFFKDNFLRLCLKNTFEQILVEIWCLKYQK